MPQTGTKRMGPGGLSYTLSGKEYIPGVSGTPGVVVARDAAVPVVTNTLQAKMSFAEEMTQANSRFADNVDVPEIETDEGVLTFNINAALGLDYYEALLGASTSLSAVNVTAVGANVTADGVTTIPATGAFVPGAGLLANPGGASEEPTQIVSYTAGVLKVSPALKINATASNMPVLQPAQDMYANSLLPAGFEDDLMLLTIERVVRGKWGELFPSVITEKADFTFSKGLPKAAFSLYGTNPSEEIDVSSLTPFAPSDADMAKALSPFSSINMMLAVGDDPEGVGTSHFRGAIGITDAKLTYDNALIKAEVEGNPIMQAWAGDKVACTITFNVFESDRRRAVWNDFVKADVGSAFHVAYAKNYGSKTSPARQMICFRAPYNKYRNPALTDEPNKMVEYAHSMKGIYQRGNEADLLRIFVTV